MNIVPRIIRVGAALALAHSGCSVSGESMADSSGSNFMAPQLIRGSVEEKIGDLFFLGGIETGKLADAAGRGDTMQMQLSVGQGAIVDGVGGRGMTPLLWAIGKRNLTGFRWLLEHGANPNLVSCCDIKNSKLSPMKIAAAVEDGKYLEALLAHGGNVNLIADERQQTPLFSVVLFRRAQNIDLLIQHHADLNAKESTNIAVGGFGNSVLSYAVGLSHFEIAVQLLRAGADPCLKDGMGRSVINAMAVRPNTGTTSEDRDAFPQVVGYLKQYTCS